MGKKRSLAVELEQSGSPLDLQKNEAFLLHFQDSILLALLGQGKLTQPQYEQCIAALRRRQKL